VPSGTALRHLVDVHLHRAALAFDTSSISTAVG